MIPAMVKKELGRFSLPTPLFLPGHSIEQKTQLSPRSSESRVGVNIRNPRMIHFLFSLRLAVQRDCLQTFHSLLSTAT